MSSATTREKILDAAEELFAENGVSVTSVRAITSKAGANIASLNYHFGSKDALIDAVYARRIGPINDERIRLLDEVERTAGSGAPALEDILEAFLAPAIRLVHDPTRGGERFMRLMGRLHSEPGNIFREHVSKQFVEVVRRYEGALRRTLPDLPSDERFWRFHFVVGAMAHTMAHSLNLVHYMKDAGIAEADPMFERGLPALAGEPERILPKLVRFCAAGMRAEAGTPRERAGVG